MRKKLSQITNFWLVVIISMFWWPKNHQNRELTKPNFRLACMGFLTKSIQIVIIDISAVKRWEKMKVLLPRLDLRNFASPVWQVDHYLTKSSCSKTESLISYETVSKCNFWIESIFDEWQLLKTGAELGILICGCH